MIRSTLAALLLAAAAPLAAQTIAITGGTVALGDGSAPIQGATVVIRDGRILTAGPDVAIPRDAEVVDARGKWVTPGIVAGFSRLGLSEVDLSADGTTDDGEGLRGGGRRDCDQQSCKRAGDHLTSPSPGWPSSKSLTGRRLGSLASYISAPSIQTRSGRV